MLRVIFMRDVASAFRSGGGALAGLAFYLLVFLLFSFALGPEMLPQAAAGVLTATLLLATLMSLPMLYERDEEEGILEQYLLHPMAVEWVVLAKMAAYWVAHALPLVVFAPMLAAGAGMPAEHIGGFALRLMIASVAVVATASLGAALTLQHRRGGMARALILLPLYMPSVIFTVSAYDAALPTLLLAAWALLMMPVSCYVSALLIRNAIA